jgi:hypothetical protein
MNWWNRWWAWLGRLTLRPLPPIVNYLYNPATRVGANELPSITPYCTATQANVITINGKRFGTQGFVTLVVEKTGEEWVSVGGPTNAGQGTLKLFSEATELGAAFTLPDGSTDYNPGNPVSLPPSNWSPEWLAFVTPQFVEGGDAYVTVTSQNGAQSEQIKITLAFGA